MRINHVQLINVTPYKASSNSKSDKYRHIAEKRAYIDNKTEPLEDIIVLTTLGAVADNVFHVDPLGKNNKPSKFCIGLIVTSLVLLISKCIWQMQLSKKYDKEIKNDTKNNTCD